MRERLAVERVQHGVTGPVGRGRTAVRLSALAVLERLAAERALVNAAIFGTRERQAKVLELVDRLGRLATHCAVSGALAASRTDCSGWRPARVSDDRDAPRRTWSPSQSDPLTVSYACHRQSSSVMLGAVSAIEATR